MNEDLKRLRELRARLIAGGGPARAERQHAAGKMTARERLAMVVDPDSFQETFLFARHRCNRFGMEGKELPGEGVVTGYGSVDGRTVFFASQDFTVAGGSVGEATANKIVSTMNTAMETGAPFVFINDGAGARIQEGVDSLSGYGRIFYANVNLSGVVPQISVIAGPCAGGAAYSPAMTDFVIQVRGTGQLYLTGPKVIEQVTGEKVTTEQLGGVEAHSRSGLVHFVADSDEEAFTLVKRLLSFLPSNNMESPPHGPFVAEDIVTGDPVLDTLLPESAMEGYDVRTIIERLVDSSDFLEVQPHFAPNLIIGFGRMLGRTVGIIANQPCVRAGVLDIDSSAKGARFIRFCNIFNIPLVTLVDVPGFLPGTAQEYGGVIRHGAKMLWAYSASTVPKVTVVLRKAYGGAYLAMCGRDLGADVVLAWPSAEIAVMGAEGAVNVLYRKEIAAAKDHTAARAERLDEYRNAFANPFEAASRGLVDDVIEPSETRPVLCTALEMLRNKRELRPAKKHGNIPL